MKNNTSILVVLMLMLLWSGFTTEAAEPSDYDPCRQYSEAEIKLFFDMGSARINPDIDGNREALMEMDSLLTTVSNDSSWVVKNVSVRGSASPEGPAELNRKLSQRRAEAISRHFASYTDDASIPTDFHYAGANWDGLRNLVTSQPGVPDRDLLVGIIDSGSENRLSQIKQLSGGSTYRWLCDNIFPQLRASAVTLSLHRECAPYAIRQRFIIADEYASDNLPQSAVIEANTSFEELLPVSDNAGYTRYCYIKTNAVAWAMAITNIAVEADIVPHLSVTLPVYYSAWNYISHKVKFRTFAFEPELRVWTGRDNTGLFAGAHFGIAQYNMAIGGKYRYQDHCGHTPAVGGGVSIGYRKYLGQSHRWLMELTVGGGAYRLHYDVFDNSSVPHGQKVDERRKTFVGIDNVGVTFIYRLPMRKKGGGQR